MDLALATKSGSYETGCTRKLHGSVRNFKNGATEKPVLPMVHSFSLSFFPPKQYYHLNVFYNR